jgi:hypothetical protein
MSPERILKQPIDARSDIYSLGVTFYQFLSGSLPFKGDSDFDLMTAHVRTPPLVFASPRAEIPAGIEQCVMRAMEKIPADRFQSPAEFGAALEESLAAQAIAGDPKRSVDTPRHGLPGLYLGPEQNPASVQPPYNPQSAPLPAQPDGGIAGKITLTGHWILSLALLLYGASFMLRAVQVGSEASGRMTGWFCAVESLAMPLAQGLKLIVGHPFKLTPLPQQFVPCRAKVNLRGRTHLLHHRAHFRRLVVVFMHNDSREISGRLISL